MKIENTRVAGFTAALRAMRNPMDSWAKSDSRVSTDGQAVIIGPLDLALASKLVGAGSEHAKFTRLINVTVDFTLPLFVWQELDTYKVGTVRVSCSTMHRLGTRDLTPDNFEDGMIDQGVLACLNVLGVEYRHTKDFDLRYQMRSMLPWNYLQRSTWGANYAVLRGMYLQRHKHRLPQWRTICSWIETLPYAQTLITP